VQPEERNGVRDISALLTVGGGGRKRKTADIEDEILAKLEKDNYHTRLKSDFLPARTDLKGSVDFMTASCIHC